MSAGYCRQYVVKHKQTNSRKHMNRVSSLKPKWRAGCALAAIAAAIYTLSLVCLTAADPTPDKEVKTETQTQKKAEKKKFSGADLYAMHCNRCHPERYATERTASQWKTVMLHMRVRANLPTDQAKAILKYLQEDSGRP
jgi:mono/diheme cytochrome c family protein